MNNILKEINSPEELIDYMKKNITYGFIDKDGKSYTEQNSLDWTINFQLKSLVQSGNGILNTNIGTCWDQVELEREWFSLHGYKFKTIFIWYEVNRPNNLPTHSFLIYEDNNKYYWFEHSFIKNMGIHEFDSEESAIEYVKEKQHEYALSVGATNEDRESIVAYVYDKIKPNISPSEYINYVTKIPYLNNKKNIL